MGQRDVMMRTLPSIYQAICKLAIFKLLGPYLCLLVTIVVECPAGAEDWPQFRGPRGDGTSLSTELPVTWGGIFDKPKWKTVVPGRGWSSPVVSGNRIWVTSAETTAMVEHRVEKALGENPHGSLDFQTVESVSLLAIELDGDTGAIVRKKTLATVANPAPIHAQNSYASPTPIIDEERVYCHFGALGTFCIDRKNFETLWSTTLAIDDITGSGATPLLFEDRLIIPCDGADEQYLIALDRSSGKVSWKTPRPPITTDNPAFKRAFSTPVVVQQAERTQVLSTTAQWLVSYNPKDGSEWWRARIGTGYSLIPRPVLDQGVAFVCSGFMKPEMFAIRIDGSGDVSQSHLVWKKSRQVPEISSPVVSHGNLYCVSSLGVATCIRTSDGELLWQHRIPGTYSASPVAAGDKIYFTSQSGITTVVAAENKYREIASNELFGETYASLAVIGNDLLIRSHPALYRIGK
jgi:outer membrane protein assembly factor BamB